MYNDYIHIFSSLIKTCIYNYNYIHVYMLQYELCVPLSPGLMSKLSRKKKKTVYYNQGQQQGWCMCSL